ncbi:MAG: substrate-binding domain-containing protein [Syntrophales bacterium]
MSEEMMSTKELSSYLNIHEKQIYALIRAGRIPATRLTGKWLFPKKVIDQWIEDNSKEGLAQVKKKRERIAGALLASGSNDPVLDILQTCLRKSHPEFYIFSANTGSTEGLAALDKGFTDIAWSHLFDPETGEYNVPYLAKLLPHIRAVVVNLFYRELGFLTVSGNPRKIKGFADLTRPDIRFLNRQEGSGTRLLTDFHLKKLNISPGSVAGYDNDVYTHMETGLGIFSGEVDTGIATKAVASIFNLDFIPVVKERFDMICDQSVFFQQGVQALVAELEGDVFRKRVAHLGSYDFTNAGKILYAMA